MLQLLKRTHFYILIVFFIIIISGIASAICPDAIRLTASPSTILAGGYESWITVQLYSGGSAIAESGVGISWWVDNPSIASIVGSSSTTTDSQGQSYITLQSCDSCNGWVRVYAQEDCTNLISYIDVYITGWGTITGTVYDENKVSVGSAIVKLYPNAYQCGGSWCHDPTTDAIDWYVWGNPQDSSDGTIAPLGRYQFEHVPYGTYYVEADVSAFVSDSAVTGYSIVTMNGGTVSADIIISNNIHPTPTTSPSATAEYASLSGYITDVNMGPVIGAVITLWPGAILNAGTASWEHDPTTMAIDNYVADNPQYSNDGTTAVWGTYYFENIPFGSYYVEADVTSLTATYTETKWFAIIDINKAGGHTANIAIPNFVAPYPSTISTTTIQSTTTTTTTLTASTPIISITTTTTTNGGSGYLLGFGGIFFIAIACVAVFYYLKTKNRIEPDTGTLKAEKETVASRPPSMKTAIDKRATEDDIQKEKAKTSKQNRVKHYKLLLEKLEKEYKSGKVPDDIYKKLKAEYESELEKNKL